jgi:hypothetical protein
MKEILNNLNACDEAMEWAKTVNYDWPRIYNECERGDWLLWLHNRTNKTDFKQRTLVKGLVSKTVEHIMKDQRSKDAVKAAIDFGNGLISVKELAHTAYAAADAAAAAYAAYAAAADAVYAAAAAAVYAAYAAADAAADAAYAAAAAYAADAAYAAAADAYAAAAAYAAAYAADADVKKQKLKEYADIFRSVIKIEDFKINVQ